MEWPIPKDVSELRSFLGLTNYYRRFINRYSHIATPLTNLLRKDFRFTWTKSHQESYERLKGALTSAPVLQLVDTSKPFQIETDASDYAIGAVLLQEVNGYWHPVAYESRKLTPAEQCYPIYDRELLALIYALRTWRHYVLGNAFIAYIDHKGLEHFTTKKELTGRQARWSELLQEFEVDIRYVRGNRNIVADSLSRRPDLQVNSITSVESNLLLEITQGYHNDTTFGEIYGSLKDPENNVRSRRKTLKYYKLYDGILYYGQNRECVPNIPGLQTRIISQYHGTLLRENQLTA